MGVDYYKCDSCRFCYPDTCYWVATCSNRSKSTCGDCMETPLFYQKDEIMLCDHCYGDRVAMTEEKLGIAIAEKRLL